MGSLLPSPRGASSRWSVRIAKLYSSPVDDGGSLPSPAIVVFADGDIARTISGPATGMNELLTTAVDGAGRIFAGDSYGLDGGTGV